MASWLGASPLLGGEMTVNIHRYRWKELLEISNQSKFKSNRFNAMEAMVPQKWCCMVEGGGGGRGGVAGVRGWGGWASLCPHHSNKRHKNFATCGATTSLVSSPSP